MTTLIVICIIAGIAIWLLIETSDALSGSTDIDLEDEPYEGKGVEKNDE